MFGTVTAVPTERHEVSDVGRVFPMKARSVLNVRAQRVRPFEKLQAAILQYTLDRRRTFESTEAGDG
jgi:hypothetical protein